MNFWNTWLAVFSILGSFFTSIALFSEIYNHGLVGTPVSAYNNLATSFTCFSPSHNADRCLNHCSTINEINELLIILYCISFFSLFYKLVCEIGTKNDLWMSTIVGRNISDHLLVDCLFVMIHITASYTKRGDFFEGTSGYWTWLFCLSKFAELGDTVLIVLRKKPLIFLHWYHHVLTLNYGIISYTHHTPYNTWIIWLNFTVHSFMYRLFLFLVNCFNIWTKVVIFYRDTEC